MIANTFKQAIAVHCEGANGYKHNLLYVAMTLTERLISAVMVLIEPSELSLIFY